MSKYSPKENYFLFLFIYSTHKNISVTPTAIAAVKILQQHSVPKCCVNTLLFFSSQVQQHRCHAVV